MVLSGTGRGRHASGRVCCGGTGCRVGGCRKGSGEWRSGGRKVESGGSDALATRTNRRHDAGGIHSTGVSGRGDACTAPSIHRDGFFGVCPHGNLASHFRLRGHNITRFVFQVCWIPCPIDSF
jgi:hypothetical protein